MYAPIGTSLLLWNVLIAEIPPTPLAKPVLCSTATSSASPAMWSAFASVTAPTSSTSKPMSVSTISFCGADDALAISTAVAAATRRVVMRAVSAYEKDEQMSE